MQQENTKMLDMIRKNKIKNTKTQNARVAGSTRIAAEKLRRQALRKEPGIDGILVTVGLCIIALLLCVVMKNSMTSFIQTIVTTLTTEAQKILTGVTGGIIL